ncbi:C2 domain-containing protein 5 isoform X2 [Frankliniella occidentalis]|uniref:C2 domain-containing protein 5 isoform X2 n=1 Tax=Frankliniella occidentalis TaxID=133901 RepID=A0A6J1SLB9_FRAOC|nr:C2 domain-containing protein 5 isoform X2 [Frankliniella occidentalis]
MPGKVKVKIVAGRNLPVMDRSSDTTDAYVEIKLGNTTYKTDVCRKSLNPQWNSEWYRFEVDDSELQDEPLQLRLMDHDTYSANDAIGKVYLDLNPLLLPVPPPAVKNVRIEGNAPTSANTGSVMSGWIPVFDTMHGIRGEVQVIVKVELFSDFNRFRQSSCGVLFFCSSVIPQGYNAQIIHGFVEELVVNDDPEYQWIDKIRTPRASNEARQTLFFKLSGEVQRKIGLKALDLGGNAVIGYRQCFDLEGESGIVARGIGTAVSLVRLQESAALNTSSHDESFLSPFRTTPCLYAAPSSPRLFVIPPTPTTCINPSMSPLLPKQSKDDRLLPLMGSHFPKAKLNKKGKKRPVVVIPLPSNPKAFTHRRQGSAPFELLHHVPYKRQNSTKSLVTDLSDLRRLLEQEDMRQSSGSPGSSRFMKAIRHLPKKVNALRGRMQSTDDSDLDTISCSSTKSLSFDLRRKSLKQSRNDSVTAALIRSIMMESGRELDDGGGLSRVVESEETMVSAPATPKLNLFPSSSEIELGGAKELIHQISSDIEESIAFIESSSSSSSSCGSSTTGDEITDSSAAGLKDEENSIVDDYDLLEEKLYCDDASTSHRIAVDTHASPGKTSKGRVTFVIAGNETVHFDRKKSRSLSPKGQKSSSDVFRKEVSLSPILVKHKRHPKLNNSSQSSSLSSSKLSFECPQLNSPKLQTDCAQQNLSSLKAKRGRVWKQSNVSVCDVGDVLQSNSPFDQEFNAATVALKTTHFDVNIEDLPQPFESPNPQTPPNTSSSISLPPSPSTLECDLNTGNSRFDVVASTFINSLSACADSSDKVDALYQNNMKGKDRKQSLLDESIIHTNLFTNSPTISKPMLDQSKVQNNFTNVVINLERAPTPQPNEHKLQATLSMDSSSKTSNLKLALEKSVSDNPVCSLTLDSPRVLSPLHKSRSTTSLVCRHEAAAASHFATDGEREGQGHDEDRAVPHGLSAQLSSSALKHSQSPAKLTAAPSIHRRSSDSDLSVTPKGNSLTGSGSSYTGHQTRPPALLLQPPIMNQDNFEMLEYPFLTVSKFPPGFVQNIGGTVSSRSVKLLERITNLEEPETRDTWWKELRMEVRSHARALGCNVVLGYSEHTSICDDVCVLSAAGTAAVISLQYSSSDLDTSGGGANTAATEKHQQGQVLSQGSQVPQISAQPSAQIDQSNGEQSAVAAKEQQHLPNQGQPQPSLSQAQTTAPVAQVQKQASTVKVSHDRVTMTTSLDRNDFEKDRGSSGGKVESTSGGKSRCLSESGDGDTPPGCVMCHIPYSESSVPFRVKMMKCAMCRKGKVPDVLLTTMEPPEGIPVTGRGCLLQAYVCRPKRDAKGELNAKEISDGLPFLEYELHRMLLNKLKVKGMNSIFGLRVQVSIGERMLVGLATGTAMFLTPLPAPPVPTITAGNSWSDERRLLEVQKTLAETVKRNREIYQLKPICEGENSVNGRSNQSDTEDSDDDLPEMDLATGNKDTCVMEVDDNEDVDVISLLMDPHPPDGFFVVNTEVVPGLEEMEVVRNLQMFTQVWRAKVTPSMPPMVFSKHFHRMLNSVYFKLRRMVPCALGQLQFFVELPEPDELQLSLLGMALGLGETEKTTKSKRKAVPPSTSKEHLKKDDNDLIFSLEEDVVLEDTTGAAAAAAVVAASSAALTNSNKHRPKSPHRATTLDQRLKNPPKLRHTPPRERYGVDITPLSYIPGGKIERYLGNLNFFFIRESTAIRESGGLSGFVHSFIAEVLAIVRAHVTALGGNAMVAYFISENVLLHNPHKNQGQCLINVGGDVVHVSYYSNDQ